MVSSIPLTPSPSPPEYGGRGERFELRLSRVGNSCARTSPIVNHKTARTLIAVVAVIYSTLAYGQQPAADAPPDPPGRRVFVPLEELDALIQKDQKWVLLPR